MLDKELVNNPQFIKLIRRLLAAYEEKLELAEKLRVCYLDYQQRLQELNSTTEELVEEFNAQMNCGDG